MSSFRRMMTHILGGLPVFGLYVLFPLGLCWLYRFVINRTLTLPSIGFILLIRKNHECYFSSLHPIKLSGMQKFRPLSKKKKKNN